ncbi:MAG: hypothetical protein ACTSPD_02120 [Promethearchaeota archaeon]
MSEFEEKVIKLLEGINEKLDKLLDSNSIASVKTSTTLNEESGGLVKPSAVLEKQEMEERTQERPPVEGRRVCPDCGGKSFRTEEDKSKVVHQMGGVKIYAKRYVCKQCGKVVY